MPRLVCTHGNNAEEIFAIKEGVNRVGRCTDTAIKVFDKACSRAHAEIYRRGDYIAIEDLGSRHGTFVNGKRIAHRVKLHLGDRVDIGHTVLRLAEGEGVVAKPAPPAAETAAATETKTQEISAELLSGDLALLKQRLQQPKINLFQRLFGAAGEEGGASKERESGSGGNADGSGSGGA